MRERMRNCPSSSAFSSAVHDPPLRFFISSGIRPRMRSTSATKGPGFLFLGCEQSFESRIFRVFVHQRACQPSTVSCLRMVRHVRQATKPRCPQRNTRRGFRMTRSATAAATRPGRCRTKFTPARTPAMPWSVVCKALRIGCSCWPSNARCPAMRSISRPRRTAMSISCCVIAGSGFQLTKIFFEFGQTGDKGRL